MIPQPTDKYILVVGLGRSGISAATFFKKHGFQIVATDINPAQKENPKIIELEALGIKTEIGFHNIETFENAQLIVVSPGIALDGEHFKRAIKRGVSIRGEFDIAAEYIKEPIVAITGTNGKTTVTTLISEMLKCSGLKVFTGGNIGTPLIEYLDQDDKSATEEFSKFITASPDPNNPPDPKGITNIRLNPLNSRNYDVVVAEVSSFQLDTAQNFCPNVAVLLNITEDHLNRYPNFNAYEDSKWSIFANQNEKCHAIINSNIDNSKDRVASMKLKSKITYFGSSDKLFLDEKKLSKLKGKHNQENIEASIIAALSAGASMEGIETALKNFNGLPHRIQYVATINGVDFYNDSKGTNTDATARAVEAFDRKDSFAIEPFEKTTILIMGGQDKNMDFSVLREWVQDRIKKVVLMGETKDKIYKALYGSCDMIFADNMESAVRLSFDHAKSGDTVLLSPACASFDMYGNYAERGEDFIKQVNKLYSSERP
ncbi:MAG: UDP-N-acetylmuramoyl-L-alanine--D-glutamate ligase [Desulfamplus sp.]|nr:UDP-N-acetylmuramoyl-L-alanine--D-glutamate ligase [Desulfamplus sp.]